MHSIFIISILVAIWGLCLRYFQFKEAGAATIGQSDDSNGAEVLQTCRSFP
jgi:hypothetical protein